VAESESESTHDRSKPTRDFYRHGHAFCRGYRRETYNPQNEKRFAAVATVVHASAYNGIRPEHLATLERWLLELSGDVREDVPTGPEDHSDRKQFFAELRTVLDRVLTDSEKGVAKKLFRK
jgi:hypothetical protein